MGNIYQTVHVAGLRSEKEIKALIDSGAELSAIRPDIATFIGAATSKEHISIRTVDGRKIDATQVVMTIRIRDRFENISAAVMQIKEPLIIGNDFLQANKMQLDFSDDKLKFNQYAPKIRKVYRI